MTVVQGRTMLEELGPEDGWIRIEPIQVTGHRIYRPAETAP